MEEDLFPDQSLLYLIDSEQHEEIIAEIENLKQIALYCSLPQDAKKLKKSLMNTVAPSVLLSHMVRLTRFAHCKFSWLPIRSVRNYNKEQKDFLTDMTNKLVHHGMAYPNPTS